MVRDSANQIMLYPVKNEGQNVLQHNITITGDPIVDIYTDAYGNQIGTFTHARPHQELVIDSQLVVETFPQPGPDDSTPSELQWLELDTLKTRLDFIDFIRQEDRITVLPEIQAVVDSEKSKQATPLQVAKKMCDYIFNNFAYKKGITSVETTIDEIWQLKSGVCQDFAHLLLVMLRQIGVPSRYVSGYICPRKNGMRGEGATHAWVEAYIPYYGWTGIDPTNNSVAGEAHVKLAGGKNFADCSPIRGSYRGTSNHALEVSVSVSYEDGLTTEGESTVTQPEIKASVTKNSFRRHQEMQMQQQ
jgi:transglutaminase-like putative cysteine protease